MPPTRPTAPTPTAASPELAREAPPAPLPPKDVAFPPIVRATLPTGLDLLVAEHHALPVVYVTLTLRAGGAADPADRPGLAAFLADMLLEGTTTRSRAEIVDAIEHVGGEIGASEDEDRITIRAMVLRDHLPLALALVADVATSPSLPKDAIDKVRKQSLSDLQQNLTDPGYLARRAFLESLYGAGHPYAHVGPTKASLEAIAKTDLAKFHERYFAPGNAFLIVAGDVVAAEVEAAATKAFGAWKRSGTAALEPPPPPPAPKGRSIVLVHRPKSVQATFYLGAPAVRRADPDWIPYVVGNQVLGGSASARLFLRLREEKSLTYGAYSRLEGRRGVGFAMAFANCRNEVVGEAMKEFLAEMKRFRDEPVPEQELGYAKGYLSGLFPTQVETPANVAAMVGQLKLHGLPDDYWDTYRSRVLAVSEAQARSFARFLDPDQVLVTVVGDAEAIEAPLREFGPVRIAPAD